jgi:microcystin-dependent protein
MPEAYLGQIILFAGNFAPQGWAFCNGQLIPVQQNQALFSIIGIIYGGDGVKNFALPNLQGRVPVHFGTGPTTVALGESAGSATVAISEANLPQHTHLVAPPCSNVAGTASTPVKNYPAIDATTVTISGAHATATATTTAYAPSSVQNQQMASFPSGIAGSGTPISIQQPYLGMNFIICVEGGLYPSRS